MATRKYEQRVRAEAAEETRQRILDALYQRLRDEPTKPPSVEEVARTAGVARSTVYLVFGSRAGLFDALSDRLIESEGFEHLRSSLRKPDARESLRGALEGGARAFAEHRDVFRVLFSLVELSPDAASGAVQRNEGRRAEGIAWLAGRLAEQKLLRKGVTAQEATHVIWLLAGFDAFDQLYTARGLSVDEVGRVLVDTAERTLLR